LGVELSQHDSSDFGTQPNSSPSGLLESLSLSVCDEHLDAVDEEPAMRGKRDARAGQ
jgi:hypothetical protein